jgi:hypothetical protein
MTKAPDFDPVAARRYFAAHCYRVLLEADLNGLL